MTSSRSTTAAAVTVRPVASAADRRRFVDFLYDHYADDPTFIPPLRMEQEKLINPKKSAFFEHGAMELYLAEDAAGTVVGRIAAIENGMHLRTHQDGNGFFGFFECVDDEGVAFALLDAASAWLRGRDLTGVRGPTNPRMNDVAGLLIDGFDRPPVILMPYNKPYYEAFLTAYGFERVMTMWAYYLHAAYMRSEKMERGVKLVYRRNPDLRIRTLDMERFDEEIETALSIYNDAWSNNWGHVSYTDAEARELAKDLRQIIDPDLVVFAEVDGEAVGFAFALPNINRGLRLLPRGKLLPLGLPKLLLAEKLGAFYEIRLPLLGVRKAYQGRGFDAPLILEIISNGLGKGYEACEMSWVLDTNARLINALEALGGVKDKEYGMFELSLA